MKAMYFIKRGRVQMLRGLGTPVEKETRAISYSENFGLSAEGLAELEAALAMVRSSKEKPEGEKDDEQGGDDARISAVFTKHYAQESARAVTYCDAVSLSMGDLVAVLKLGKSKWMNKIHRPSVGGGGFRGPSGGVFRRMSLDRLGKKMTSSKFGNVTHGKSRRKQSGEAGEADTLKRPIRPGMASVLQPHEPTQVEVQVAAPTAPARSVAPATTPPKSVTVSLAEPLRSVDLEA